MTRRAIAVRRSLLALALGCLFAAPSATAQTTAGMRAGASVNPDQFYFGAHIETPPLADRVRFRPNIEVGVGNDLTLVGANFELAYFFPQREDWALYAGGGPAMNIINANGDTDADGGFNVLLGGQHQSGLFLEIKVGAIGSPDLKIGIGYSFL